MASHSLKDVALLLMAHLTQEECDIIDENPPGDSLSGVREALREASSEAEHVTGRDASQSDDTTCAPERPRLFVAAIGKLFNILSGSDVSLLLASRMGREALVSDLTAIRLRIHKGDLEYKQCRPLSKLVIKQAQDFDIWAAVIALV